VAVCAGNKWRMRAFCGFWAGLYIWWRGVFLTTSRSHQQIMKHWLLYWLLSAASLSASGQDFQFKQISLNQIDSIEKRQKAYPFKFDYSIGVSDDYFPRRKDFDLAQPIVYRKKIKSFKYETSYYYSLPDSTIRLIEYWWEGTSNSTAKFYEVINNNRRKIASGVNYKGKYVPATEISGTQEITENDAVYVEQFYVEGLQRIRVKISWK
jgi:hypothetical protein